MQDNHLQGTVKKVFHLITKGSPFGGAQHYVYTLATHLPKQYTSTVLCGTGQELPQKLIHAQKDVLYIKNLKRDVNFISDLSALWEIVHILKKTKPDILHTNSSKAGFLGALAGRITGVPRIIFTGHAWVFNEKRSWMSKKIFTIFQWMTIIFSHHTIIVSKKARLDVRSLPGVKVKSSVIYSGLTNYEVYSQKDAQNFFTTTYSIPKPLLTEDILWIGTLSELHVNKGIDLTLQALANMKHLPWIFIVCGEGEERASLENMATDMDISERVFFIGNVPHAREYVRAFDVFTLTSRTENLPYALLEAGHAGLAVVASRVGGVSEIVDNDINGVVVLPQSKQIQEGLEFLIHHPEKRKEFGEELQKKISRDFSIDHMIEQTVRVYRGEY